MTRRSLLVGAALGFIAPRVGEIRLEAALQADAIFTLVPPEKSGILWVHDNARRGGHYAPETVGPGCGFIDFDNDGWTDIYLMNSGPCDFFKPANPPRNALYRNNRDGTFTDVTLAAGVQGGNFGMGVAVGDYDGDGFPDLLVAGYGRNILYHNNGDGTFTDVTEKAGLEDNRWSSSATWFDYDNDGRLDLFVCHYVDYSADPRDQCFNAQGKTFYCLETQLKPLTCSLYHNNGDGSFSEVGHQTVIGQVKGKALGVVAADFNNDGWMDLFVANDTLPNWLFANRGAGKWEEIGLRAGVACSDEGQVRGGMGVGAADFDQDGKLDFVLTNFNGEQFSLYHNDGHELFSDWASRLPIGDATRTLSGWGTKFLDYDNDGNLDLIFCSGHPDPDIGKISPYSYLEPLLLFRNTGHGFVDVSRDAGTAFQQNWAARGLALGDLDNDGALDVLIGINGGAPLLLKNQAAAKNNWLGVRLVGRDCNRDAVGARIKWSSGSVVRSRYKVGGSSFCSSHDPRVVLGLGQAKSVDWLEVAWPPPSRRVERLTGLSINRYITVNEGSGRVVTP
ncbi:MAG TPA: CRTAC1 family protein [Terriglobia bacterium]|nr:CRTAC1 family protein [Terriglobia bacterium]